jgi:hypothetical protein
MKPAFVSPMTMCKTAWGIASGDLLPAFRHRLFGVPENRSAGTAQPRYTALRRCPGTPISSLPAAHPLALTPSAENNPHSSVRRPAA